MCARYTIAKEKITIQVGEIEVVVHIKARHNVAPSQQVFGSVLNNPDRDELNWCPVQRALNNVKNEGAELLRTEPKGLF